MSDPAPTQSVTADRPALVQRVAAVWLSRSAWVLLALAGTFPLLMLASSRSAARFRNEITEWADPTTEASQRFAEFRTWFGPNEYVLLTWPDCTRADARLQRVEQLLTSDRLGGMIESVNSGRSVFNVLRDRGRLDETMIQDLSLIHI